MSRFDREHYIVIELLKPLKIILSTTKFEITLLKLNHKINKTINNNYSKNFQP